MGILQDTFDMEVEKLPRTVLLHVVTEKLVTLGFDEPDLAAKITEHVLSGDTESISWESADDAEIELVFGDKDIQRIDEKVGQLTEALPDIVENLTKNAGRELLADFRGQWAKLAPRMNDEVEQFNARLQARWGESLQALRLLLELSRDIGLEFQQQHLRSKLKANQARNDALMRLHARACQVTSEILVLLENGYADGASTRWRTLFEISTVATLIADSGDAIAERYLAHAIVDRKKTLEEYQKCAPSLGEPPISVRDAKAIRKEYEAALRKYGKAFRQANGWAAGFFGLNANPNFLHLQEAAGRAAMRIYYKLASFGVHAGASAFERQYFPFHESVQIAGATNAGLSDVGHNTANSLMHITSLLINEPWDIDKLAHVQALLQLRDEICSSFAMAARKLERDEARQLTRAVRRADQRKNGR